MAKISMDQIQNCGFEILKENPSGVQFGELVAEVLLRLPGANENSVGTEIAALPKELPDRVYRPSRGILRLKDFDAESSETPPTTQKTVTTARESDYYESFAKWLRDEHQEAVESISLGGAGMRTKWGTPDVVGVYRPVASDRVKFTPEIVAAEIKIDPSESITALGQAVAYRLFATRSYVVMPNTIGQDDLSRLKALAMLVGIGIVLFSPDPERPNYQALIVAQRLEPDMFYVNDFAERLHGSSRKLFNQLFA